jgi:multidrug resistance protein, MATE family
VLVAQLLSMGMMVADTLIAGRYGTRDLAGIAVGSSVYISLVMLLNGVVQAIAPTVAHHVGAARHAEIAPALQQGFWLALLLAVPGVLLLSQPSALLELAGVPEGVRELATRYLAAMAWGLPAVLLYKTFHAFVNAINRPRALMLISAIMTGSHVPLAWALVHGGWGLPALGGPGCGISSSIVNWLGLACALAYLRLDPVCRGYRVFSGWQPPRLRQLGALLRLGLPIGLSTFIDITSFTLISIFAARIGTETVAGHRLLANLTGLVYMVPLSLSIATLVLVGQACGARDWQRARRTVRVGLLLVAACGLLIGCALWLLQDPLIGLASTDPAVRAVALGLVGLLCVYQLFDGIQLLIAFALRGYKVTLLPMLLHSLCFWGVGLAGGYWLSFQAGERALQPSVAGFWEASVLAMALASLLLAALLRRVTRARRED